MKDINPPAIVRSEHQSADRSLSELANAGRDAIKRGEDGLLEAGLIFLEAKSKCKHGEWMEWVKVNLKISIRHVDRIMRASKLDINVQFGGVLDIIAEQPSKKEILCLRCQRVGPTKSCAACKEARSDARGPKKFIPYEHQFDRRALTLIDLFESAKKTLGQASAFPELQKLISALSVTWGKCRAELIPTPEASQARQDDPLFNALAKLTASDPRLLAGHIGKVCKELRSCDPPYTPEEVKKFGEIGPKEYEWMRGRITLGVVVKYIGIVRVKKSDTGHDETQKLIAEARAAQERIRNG